MGAVTDLDAKDAPVKDVHYELKGVEAQSTTHLESDEGGGGSAVIRMFEFRMDPVAFQMAHPNTQDLFNAHHKGIEIALWRDGLKPMPEINPRVVMELSSGTYRIFVTAKPERGQLLSEQPKTLSQLIHGGKSN